MQHRIIPNWKIPEIWKGETVFIVGGGPSVALQRPHRLEGRKVIAINSSYETCPFAQFLFFGDHRWHEEHKKRPEFIALRERGCEIVTVSAPALGGYLRKLLRIVPLNEAAGFTATRVGLSSQKTSFQGAMNLAVMLGGMRLVLLGMDGKRSDAGLTHHHKPHKWPTRPGDSTWKNQLPQLSYMVPHLKARGVEVFNTCEGSQIPFWPYASIEGFL